VHDHEVEKHAEDKGAGVAVRYAFTGWRWRCPCGAEHAVFYGGCDFGDVGRGVGGEDLAFELREHVADAVGLVGELDAEEGFEEGNELGCDVGLEGGHVGEGEEAANGLCC